MRKILIVIKYEIVTTLQKRSFWVMTFLFPGLIIVFNLGIQVMAQNTFEQEDLQGILSDITTQPETTAYVDQAGLLRRLPASLPAETLHGFASEADARAALAAGQFDYFFLVPADYVSQGDLILITKDFRPLNTPNAELLTFVLTYNLTGDEATAVALLDPTTAVQPHALAPPTDNDQSNPLTFFVPFATMFIFFFLISMSSGFMLQSVTREKENRTVEVLLLSLQPRELMLGKVLGLSVVALIQMAVWLGGSLLVLNRTQSVFASVSAFTLPPGFVAWALLYFALGYLLYASLMGAIGALAPNAREGGQFTFFVLLPLLIPLWLNAPLIQSPHGPLSTALSLFPLTAPTAMMTRMASGGVPTWQLLTSLGGLALTTYLFVSLAARFFRADTLLSAAPLKWQHFFTQLRQS
ncbi:MAG: ABC transporter permease [Chloroflexi bacterium]|nr:ABC transporter permease [Chloroflexota bacterium]